MNQSTIKKIALFLICMTSSAYANAHGAEAGGLINGLMHPIFGVDHLLAMIAVGALSVQIGGRAIWLVPLTFVSVMVIGGVLGMLGMPFMALETGIALSVLLLGIAIASHKKLSIALSMLCVGIFAIFHGYAHGAEMPLLAEPTLYSIGFVLSTAFLHIVGISIGEIAKNIKDGENLLRFFGAGMAGVGFAILFGL